MNPEQLCAGVIACSRVVQGIKNDHRRIRLSIRISRRSMGVMMVVMAPTDGLSQILHIRKLAALRGAAKIAGQLAQLSRRRGIAVGLGHVSGILQIGGDLLRDLLVLGWIGLLKLLQHAHHLGKR